MGEIKRVGSEKLDGPKKLERILELTYKGLNQPSSKINENFDVIETREVNNEIYGLVKEQDGYYVKKGLNESSLEYIGGLFMKNKNKFDSYAEGMKRLDFLVGQTLAEQKKYFLKTPESDVSIPSIDSGEIPSDAIEASGDENQTPPMDEPNSEPKKDEMSNEKTVDGDPLKDIHRMTGKLSEALRKSKKSLESDDIKYVLNSILSAINISNLNDDDKDDVLRRFEKSAKSEPTDSGSSSNTDSDIDKELGEVWNKLSSMVKTKNVGLNESTFSLSSLID
jgi:hypothetical protein